MVESYIDLESRIAEDEKIDEWPQTAVLEGILHWLDDHPEACPGQTITESEFDQRTSLCSELEAYWFKVGYFAAGGNIVADPEPTNVDRLKALYMEWKREVPTALDFAEWMDIRGVKAPDVCDG